MSLPKLGVSTVVLYPLTSLAAAQGVESPNLSPWTISQPTQSAQTLAPAEVSHSTHMDTWTHWIEPLKKVFMGKWHEDYLERKYILMTLKNIASPQAEAEAEAQYDLEKMLWPNKSVVSNSVPNTVWPV